MDDELPGQALVSAASGTGAASPGAQGQYRGPSFYNPGSLAAARVDGAGLSPGLHQARAPGRGRASSSSSTSAAGAQRSMHATTSTADPPAGSSSRPWRRQLGLHYGIRLCRRLHTLRQRHAGEDGQQSPSRPAVVGLRETPPRSVPGSRRKPRAADVLSRLRPGSVPVNLYINRDKIRQWIQWLTFSFFVVPVSRQTFPDFPCAVDGIRSKKNRAEARFVGDSRPGLGPLETYRDDVAAVLDHVEVVSVCLHHHSALFLELFAVVGLAVLVV